MTMLKPVEDYKDKEIETLVEWATAEMTEWNDFRRGLFAERKRRAKLKEKKVTK